MSWYAEMGKNTMVARGDYVRAVGWLSSGRPFSTGEVPAEFLTRLSEFYLQSGKSSRALSLSVFGGVHTCEFCEKVHDSRDFGVPTERELFVAPGMILHYIQAHSYKPPSQFISAVLTAPLPDTPEFEILAAPFRRLREAERERERRKWLAEAARMALQLGGTEEAVRETASQMYGNDADEVCQWIWDAMRQ